jgi:hypothetical protein
MAGVDLAFNRLGTSRRFILHPEEVGLRGCLTAGENQSAVRILLQGTHLYHYSDTMSHIAKSVQVHTRIASLRELGSFSNVLHSVLSSKFKGRPLHSPWR